MALYVSDDEVGDLERIVLACKTVCDAMIGQPYIHPAAIMAVRPVQAMKVLLESLEEKLSTIRKQEYPGTTDESRWQIDSNGLVVPGWAEDRFLCDAQSAKEVEVKRQCEALSALLSLAPSVPPTPPPSTLMPPPKPRIPVPSIRLAKAAANHAERKRRRRGDAHNYMT